MKNMRSRQRLLTFALAFVLWCLPASAYEVTNLTQLTDGPISEQGCTFNTDGTKIAYRNLHAPYSWANCDIWVMRTDGSAKTRITTDSRGEFDPRFVPDGRIVYTKEFGSNDYDLWIVNADGWNPHELIGGAYRQTTCRFHPSGNKLVYCNEYKRDACEIWTANPDGSGKFRLTSHTTDGYTQSYPVYSRSGNLIAYSSCATSAATPQLWITNQDGSRKRQVTFEADHHTAMFWWSDDSRIGYTKDGEIWLHDLSTGVDELLLKVPNGQIGWTDLSPDGTNLIFDLSFSGVFGSHIWVGDIGLYPPDECGDAIAVQLNEPYHGTTIGSTGTDTSSCSYEDTVDVWHSFTPKLNYEYTISLCGSAFDTTLAVFEGCGGRELACNDDTEPGVCPSKWQSELTIPLVNGSTYFIRIAGYDGATGDYVLTVAGPKCTQEIPVDLNNDCKVDFVDLAMVASYWLDCNLDPPEACWE